MQALELVCLRENCALLDRLFENRFADQLTDEFQALFVSFLLGDVCGRFPFVVASGELGPTLQEEFDALSLSVKHCSMQRRTTIFVRNIYTVAVLH